MLYIYEVERATSRPNGPQAAAKLRADILLHLFYFSAE